MSFLSIMKTIGVDALKVLGVALPVAQPIAAVVLSPAAGAVLGKISSAVIGAESVIQGAQQGAAKKQTVAQIVNAELPTVDAVVAELGPNMHIDQAALNTAIDSMVAAFNSIQQIIAAAKAANSSTASSAPAKS